MLPTHGDAFSAAGLSQQEASQPPAPSPELRTPHFPLGGLGLGFCLVWETPGQLTSEDS